jgi:hypothetical protein
MSFVIPGTARLLCGKQMSLLFRNPSTSPAAPQQSPALPNEWRIEEFSFTPKVNSAKYADSLSSGYMRNTSGVFEADGSLVVNLTSEGSIATTVAAGGVGVAMDDLVDIQFFTTLAMRLAQTPQLSGTIHINSVSKPFKTVDSKIACRIDFTLEGLWIEA